MTEDMVRVSITLDNQAFAILRFRREVYLRHVGEAQAAGVSLQDYLARKLIASGIGESPISKRDGEPALALFQPA
jgi:hypothetical protein